jgi:hypothetical protein
MGFLIEVPLFQLELWHWKKKKCGLFSAIVQNVKGTLISCNLPV